jgi:hypothetical protein
MSSSKIDLILRRARKKVSSYLLASLAPTLDEPHYESDPLIIAQVLRRFPTIRKPTIYKVLDTLRKEGLIEIKHSTGDAESIEKFDNDLRERLGLPAPKRRFWVHNWIQLTSKGLHALGGSGSVIASAGERSRVTLSAVVDYSDAKVLNLSELRVSGPGGRSIVNATNSATKCVLLIALVVFDSVDHDATIESIAQFGDELFRLGIKPRRGPSRAGGDAFSPTPRGLRDCTSWLRRVSRDWGIQQIDGAAPRTFRLRGISGQVSWFKDSTEPIDRSEILAILKTHAVSIVEEQNRKATNARINRARRPRTLRGIDVDYSNREDLDPKFRLQRRNKRRYE